MTLSGLNSYGSVSSFKNGETLLLSGLVDAKPYLTGIFIVCRDPSNALVLADVVDVPAGASEWYDTFVLGNPVTPWPAGTYTFEVYWNPNNGPGAPNVSSLAFSYSG